jgi:hypothetical protein
MSVVAVDKRVDARLGQCQHPSPHWLSLAALGVATFCYPEHPGRFADQFTALLLLVSVMFALDVN